MGLCLSKAKFEQLYPQMDVYTCLCVHCMWHEDCYHRKPQFTEKTEKVRRAFLEEIFREDVSHIVDVEEVE